MKKAALHNLGCKVNAYETEAMQELLEQDGYEIVPFHEKADVYVINTCSVTNMADRKSRQMIHKARKQNENAIVVAAGCYVQTAEQEVIDEGIADIIIGNDRKQDLVPRIHAFLEDHKQESDVLDLMEKRDYEEMKLFKTAEHTRAFLKVQDGCNQFCSYCIIPYARGRVRSRKMEDVLNEVKHLVENGYQEVVLSGIHLSSYGIDTGESLQHLIEKINEIEGIKRIRLSSLEPRVITEEFVKSISSMEKFCPHFHLSLQSGCNATLQRMNRHYSAEEFQEKCELLRNYFEHPAITTDIIVGFPGENEEEFAETKKFVEDIQFFETHIFKFSPRRGTRAEKMEHQVPEQVKAKRSNELIALGKHNAETFGDYYLGKEVEILLEDTVELDNTTYFTGITKEYVKVLVEAKDKKTNTFVRGTIRQRLEGNQYLMVEFSE